MDQRALERDIDDNSGDQSMNQMILIQLRLSRMDFPTRIVFLPQFMRLNISFCNHMKTLKQSYIE